MTFRRIWCDMLACRGEVQCTAVEDEEEVEEEMGEEEVEEEVEEE